MHNPSLLLCIQRFPENKDRLLIKICSEDPDITPLRASDLFWTCNITGQRAWTAAVAIYFEIPFILHTVPYKYMKTLELECGVHVSLLYFIFAVQESFILILLEVIFIEDYSVLPTLLYEISHFVFSI